MYRFVGRELKPLERHTNESSQGEIGRVELGKERNLSRFYKSLATAIIAVSHDRRFIESFHGEVWTLENTKLVPPYSQVMSDADNARMRAEIEDLASYADPVHGRLPSPVPRALSTRPREI